MHHCNRCHGFVPHGSTNCPNCQSTKKWWALPLAVLGASAASITLSACYGAPCVTALPDGGKDYGNSSCFAVDCETPLADGGAKSKDPSWAASCPSDAGRDGGTDGGADGGRDGGP